MNDNAPTTTEKILNTNNEYIITTKIAKIISNIISNQISKLIEVKKLLKTFIYQNNKIKNLKSISYGVSDVFRSANCVYES